MTAPLYRLADATLVEPLVQDFQAWWMTVAPMPASLHLQAYLLPLLKAYLQTPDFHAKAAKDPELSGSSFVGIAPERAEEVRALMQRMTTAQEDNIKLAEAFDEFQTQLLAEAKGQSLEPLYARLPDVLKGKVELVYDYVNRPSMRVHEGLLYRGPHHKTELQSMRLRRLKADAERDSLLTTPRLMEAGQLDWKVPFHDERLDKLFSLDVEPKPLEWIRDLLGDAVKSDADLKPLLTEATQTLPETWNGPGVRIRYVGHACVLVEWKGTSILIDAVVPVRPEKVAVPLERMSFADLPRRIDYVVITHSHPDHLDIETLLRLRHRIGTLMVPRASGALAGDYSPRLLGKALGFKNVLEPYFYESLPIPDGEIIAAPFMGEHGDVAHAKSAWIIRTGEERLFFAADSMCVDETTYRDLRSTVGDLHSVFMNTEIVGAPHTWMLEGFFPKKRDRKLEKNRRCRGSNSAEGLRLLELVGAKRIFNYAMGLEPWMEHIIGPAATPETPRMKESDLLLTTARERGLQAERLEGARQVHLKG
ncbi:MBL fold metallo-hydrolase [Corallococcus exiguus]|uniref:MBL fold metallo-hydrolase n=1 Tax=Corallococcus exiguus TaxID=83462 RepID=UPI001494D37F|nr:MBL fold metallo-hydrolase [Corallococcus exiguus]NPD22927.1 MBL fold metallo-hydrolase [Corallococcus exiguus]NRD43971.1 MBL fold metallo-hydrolase [Corallococcus exiguus]